MVGTPIMAGFGEAALLAQKCSHPSWTMETRTVEQGTVLVMERCGECIATRMKYRPVSEEKRDDA